MNRAYAVMLLSYATLLFLYLFLPFVTVLMIQRTANRLWFMEFLTAVNPFFAIGFMTTLGRFRMSGQWMTNVMLHLAAAGVLVAG